MEESARQLAKLKRMLFDRKMHVVNGIHDLQMNTSDLINSPEIREGYDKLGKEFCIIYDLLKLYGDE